MPSIIQTLQQEKMWYGQDGRPYRIEDMEQSHRINVVNFLRRRAKQLQEHAHWWEGRILAATNAPDEVFTAWERSIEDDPEEWLERKPLMQALDKAIKDHDTVDGEVVEGTNRLSHGGNTLARRSTFT